VAVQAPELIACSACGLIDERANTLFTEQAMAIDLLEKDLRGKRSQISRLTGEQERELRGSVHYSGALEVLRHWQAVLEPKAREVDSITRIKQVIARMNGGFSVEELKRCIDGYAKRPYNVKGRRRSHGKPTQRYVDVSLIFRDAKHTQEGMALNDLATEPPPADIRKLDWRKVRRANHKAIIEALRKLKLGTYYDSASRSTISGCPNCGENLTVFGLDVMVESLLYCAGGCGISEANFWQHVG
jgi:hypothetical protein